MSDPNDPNASGWAAPGGPGGAPPPPPSPPGAPPPPAEQPFASGAGYVQQGYGYGVGPTETKTHGLAVAALVCGIVGVLFANVILGPLALIFGIVSLSKIGGSNGALKGRGMAITGVVLGPIDLIVGIIVLNSVVNNN